MAPVTVCQKLRMLPQIRSQLFCKKRRAADEEAAGKQKAQIRLVGALYEAADGHPQKF